MSIDPHSPFRLDPTHAQKYAHAIALYFMHYNYCRIHQTLRERAEAFLQTRLQQGFSDSVIKSFDVPKSYLQNLQRTAVPESLAKTYPYAPIRVDITKAPDQYGLRPDQIEQLVDQIIPGSGGIEYPS
jgi:hypothetical protein